MLKQTDTRERLKAPRLRGPSKLPGVWFLDFYRSNIGKKAVMAVTGIIGLAFLVAHMIGNLKLYLGESDMNHYGEWLRTILYPGLPHSGFLWIMRIVLLVCIVLHVHAATALTLANRKARPRKYEGGRDYIAANYAARTMRWSGIIVLAFIIYHLLDLTFGTTNPDFRAGEPYHNVIESFSAAPVAVFYIIANVLLGIHIWHGAWSMFQSLGANNRRFNGWRNVFAFGIAALITVGNVSFPVAVLTGVIG
jgi:succinate dehydrogenase / fumarate reductase cytochrome b subunit